MKKTVIVCLLVALFTLSVSHLTLFEPRKPIWPATFEVDFVEGYGNASTFKTSGVYRFDAGRKAQRVDRRNGLHDPLCGSVLPNIPTTCVQLTRDDKRYVFYPERRQCCICCDAAHGCGILKRDWLSGSTYIGTQTLQDQTFDKWSIPGMIFYYSDGGAIDYYWATADSKQIPRKMDEGGSRIKDFIMVTYREDRSPDFVYDLPAYCSKVDMCPGNCKRFQ